MSGSYELSEAACVGAREVWDSHGKATRRQWWFGQLSAALLACLGLVGGAGVIMSAATEFGLDPGEIACKLLVMAVASLCLLQFAITSNSLCRRRLNERGEPHDLVGAAIGLAVLEIALVLNGAAETLLPGLWPLPSAPQWLPAMVSVLALGSLVALVLECGVFERLSLTELWRGSRRQTRVGGWL